MHADTKNIILSLFTVLVSVLFISIVIKAISLGTGTLLPSAAPAVTMHTITDIYNKITDATIVPHTDLNPTSSPIEGTYTLEDVYNVAPTPNKILYGTGAGTANTPPPSRTIAYSAEVLSGRYCFANDGTAILGEGTIVPVDGSGCMTSTWSSDAPEVVDWTVASSYCSGTIDGFADWRLPHLWELLRVFQQSGQGTFQSGSYWSDTLYLANPSVAYIADMSNGRAIAMPKIDPNVFVRCIRYAE